jgi:hypothetical protein
MPCSFEFQVFHGAAKLSQLRFANLSPFLERVPVMTPPVRAQGTEQALLNNHIPNPLKTAIRPFLLNKKHRVMLAGRVIHRHDQIPFLAENPFMPAPILRQFVCYKPVISFAPDKEQNIS